MNVTKLRGFLISLPKPAMVRIYVDGEPSELKVNNRSYQKLAETIDAMEAERLECLDSGGGLLRAMRLDDGEARRSDAADMPQVLAQDPHAAMVTHCANLIHRAYEHSTEVAFAKLVEVMDRMNDRSASIEQRLERAEAQARRLRDDQVQDAFDRAEEIAQQAQAAGGGGIADQLAQAFVSGQMNRGVARPSKPAAANGKGDGTA